jgi:hypothetical protein
MTAAPTFEGEAEAVGVAMSDRKATDREVAGVEDPAGRQRDEFKRNRRLSLTPQPREHAYDNVEGARAALNRHQVIGSSKPQSRKKTGDTEHVVEVAVG